MKSNFYIILNNPATMCGVIGIVDSEQVSFQLFCGLMALQHRGQDAAGIITSNDNTVFVKKSTGLVQQIFPEQELQKLQGTMGIAQTRYSTIGHASSINAQPLFVNATNKIAMAHNGNITNYLELKANLSEKGVFLTTTIDIEPALHLFAAKYEKTKDFFASAKHVLQTLEGSYSIVGFISDKGMFAIRDPHGIRPLVLGKKNSSYVFASESVALQTLGYEFVRDIAPGEAMFIDEQFRVQSKVLLEKHRAHCMFEWVYFARPESMIEERAVYKARLALGATLAEHLRDDLIDVVIPVPDTARASAAKLAEVLGVKYREGLIKNRYIARTFIMPSQDSRKDSVNIKLNVIISAVKDKIVAVVDDSIVRATTSKRIIKLLRDAGAKKIIFVSSCPPIKHPCFYGIDMPTARELIANDKSLEEIREFIGADKLIYATVEDLEKAIRKNLCTACLTGSYPVMVSDDAKAFFAHDKKQR
ncbi:amidophosphoribosyltransferase [Candidatus Woesearchaeota archaeon]|nr:MAG: amidophosphoribosyltransferase [Candidatus Woesearchaeota archaeon]